MKNLLIAMVLMLTLAPVTLADNVVKVGTCSVDSEQVNSISDDCASYAPNFTNYIDSWIDQVDEVVADAMQSAKTRWQARDKRAEKSKREGNRAAICRIIGC